MRRIKRARKVMRKAFEKDQGFYEGYHSNIAMLLHDKCGITDYSERNKIAKEIMRLIFW